MNYQYFTYKRLDITQRFPNQRGTSLAVAPQNDRIQALSYFILHFNYLRSAYSCSCTLTECIHVEAAKILFPTPMEADHSYALGEEAELVQLDGSVYAVYSKEAYAILNVNRYGNPQCLTCQKTDKRWRHAATYLAWAEAHDVPVAYGDDSEDEDEHSISKFVVSKKPMFYPPILSGPDDYLVNPLQYKTRI